MKELICPVVVAITTIALIALKIMGLIAWTWPWVLSPVMAWAALSTFLVAMIGLLDERQSGKSVEW